MKFNVSNKQKETKQDNTLATLKKQKIKVNLSIISFAFVFFNY